MSKPLISPYILGLLVTCAAANATDITFSVPGSSSTLPSAINAQGVITGTAVVGENVAFVRQPDGAFTTFAVPGADGGTQPSSINDEGAIAGVWIGPSTCEDFSTCGGFLRTSSGVITILRPPTGGRIASAYINKNGVIAGRCFQCPEGSAYILSPTGTFTFFGGPSGGIIHDVGGINQFGDIAGTTSVPGSNSLTIPFIRKSNGTITTNELRMGNGYIAGINALDQVAGISDIEHPTGSTTLVLELPFLWVRDRFEHFLPTAVATGLNDEGTVVGYSLNGAFARPLFGQVTFFEIAGASVTIATAINNSGTITGWSESSADPNQHAGFVRLP